MGSGQSFSAPTTHSRFSKVQFSIQDQTMLIRQPIQSIQGLNKWIEKKKLYHHIYNSPSLFLCKDYKFQPDGICASKGIFLGKYDGVYQKTLKDEILIRNLKNRYYTEQQLWYLILFISKAASQIYQYGDNHFIGNIHPNNILIDQKGNYKIIVTNYSFSLPNQRDHFTEYQINRDRNTYINSQLIGFIDSKRNIGYPFIPKYKQLAQAYSLGLTIIAMATLNRQIIKCNKKIAQGRDTKKLQRLKIHKHPQSSRTNAVSAREKRVDQDSQQNNDSLNALLLQIQKRYSTLLYVLISGLVYHQPQKRLHIDRTYSLLLQPLEKNILLFDPQWIEKLKNQPINADKNILDADYKICKNWVREQSQILRQIGSDIYA